MAAAGCWPFAQRGNKLFAMRFLAPFLVCAALCDCQSYQFRHITPVSVRWNSVSDLDPPRALARPTS